MPEKDYLWMESLDILVNLSSRVCEVLLDSSKKQLIKSDVLQQLCPIILEVFKACFIYTADNTPEFEQFDLQRYSKMRDSLVPLLNDPSNEITFNSEKNDMLEEFLTMIWTSSFLYKLNETENRILETSKSPSEVSQRLSDFRFEESYGSTKPIEPLSRLQISKSCLHDLIELSIPVGVLSERSLPYFISRCCFVLNRIRRSAKNLATKWRKRY
ncbi:unnamed protein product [Ambrosiozyma monospora]|uniref:Unnamed protein product n=1 Tax=Ambrosiozyma monospora TaxID=43982 RepID=A0A9W6TBB5_AMBMO|nr:unnamed protein product [Ambrosiozyma monospora]